MSLLSETKHEEAEPQAEAPGEEATTEPVAEETPSDRPEWLPEKFTDPAAMATAYSELERKLGSKEEDLKAALKEELTKEQFAGRPATPGDYVVPETVSDEDAVSSDLLSWWAEKSYEAGLSQEGFSEGIERFFASMPQDEAGPDPKTEIAKLGENATARMEAVELWAGKQFQDEEAEAINGLLTTAAGYQVLEKIMGSTARPKPGQGEDARDGVINAEKLREMQNDPRYHDPVKRDMDFVRKVDEGYKKLYNG